MTAEKSLTDEEEGWDCNCTLIKIKTVLLNNRELLKIKWNRIMVESTEIEYDSNGKIRMKIFVS